MDKSWMQESRVSSEYNVGVEGFLDFAESHGTPINGKFKCPCIKCGNVYYHDREMIHEHLICNGIIQNYTVWFYHGEDILEATFASNNIEGNGADEDDTCDDIRTLLHDVFEGPIQGDLANEVTSNEPTINANFDKLAIDAETKLYPGCTTQTRLSFMVRLWHVKIMCGWSNKSFEMLLALLRNSFPEGTLPSSLFQSKKLISDLGLNYTKIDACPRDCMLYYGDDAERQRCKICNTSRYKEDENNEESSRKKTPMKILRYFPLTPRLQRLYMSSKIASDMRWHENERTKDGIMRHPADSQAWKHFDATNPDFAVECRNIRLGLASDGFNPFRAMSIKYSIWPVILMPYNLPPWLCMKQSNMILSMLIPGPCGPGNDIDVYLRPLINELNDLWTKGVDTYDASTKETFKLRAALLWTISDFPGYAMLSGWSTKGKLACPLCHKDTCSRHLKNGKKHCYLGHRRFLPSNHIFRRHKKSFDGTVEFRGAPNPLSGMDVLSQVQHNRHVFGKKKGRKQARRVDEGLLYNWNKKSIFFELPYWKYNLVRHNLDVMHIEKNVCDNILKTLLNIERKTKDNLKSRLDLVEMGLRHELHPKRQEGNNRVYLPSACYSMDKNERETFCCVLKHLKVPDGYSSNFARCINIEECKIYGLKSHDSHVIIQQFLPLAIRQVLPKNVTRVLIELSTFFRELCSKTLVTVDLERLQKLIAIVLCHLERIFPPSFFDVMVHLPIHLALEALLCGPVHYRWMYPIERYLYVLKSYVRNRAQPEGSIAEAYIADECLTFCSRYLSDVETRLSRPPRNPDENTTRGSSLFRLSNVEWTQAHRYILFNHELVTSYLQVHNHYLSFTHQKARPHEQQRLHNEQFVGWFKEHMQMLRANNTSLPIALYLLAEGPHSLARRFGRYTINGYRFRTIENEKMTKTQNSGVVMEAATTSYASTRDKRPRIGEITYYGRLTDIIELTYSADLKFVLFKCDWVDVKTHGRGIKTDELGFTLVNFTCLLFSGQDVGDEPYVLASQARQVFYVTDPNDPNWHVVMKTNPRDLYDMGGESEELFESEAYGNQRLQDIVEDDNDGVNWVRDDVVGATLEAPPEMLHTHQSHSEDLMDDEDELISDVQSDGEEYEEL